MWYNRSVVKNEGGMDMAKNNNQEISVINIQETIKQKKEKERRQREQKKRQIKKKVIKSTALLATLGLGTVGVIHGMNILEERQNREASIKIQEEEKIEEISLFEQEPEEKEEKEDLTETRNNLLAFLKNDYVENYERMTGDTGLKTSDIAIRSSYENYIFINNQTGEMYTHGETPKTVMEKLEALGIDYSTEDNVKVYKVSRVIDGEEKVIDCIRVINEKAQGIVLPDQYGEPYQSVLQEMGNLIPDGLDCIEAMEQGNEKDIMITKAKFMETLEKYKVREENKTNHLELENDDELEL